MNIKIFDVYNIRARLSVYIIIIAPVILTLYAMYEPVRSFSFQLYLLLFYVHFLIIFLHSNDIYKKIRYMEIRLLNIFIWKMGI